MTYPIKYLSLQKSELQYEVELRGGSGDTVIELRKQIVKLASLLPSEDVLESHLDPADDLKTVKELLLRSQYNLGILSKQFDKNLFIRTETLLHHVYHRINRITISEELMDSYKSCKSTFKSQFTELSTFKQGTSQATPSTRATENPPDLPAISVSCDRSLSADLNKLKFSGQTCVHSFIQRVEEFVHSRGIPFEKILSLAFEIFVDDALHWFRYNKDKVATWQELCILLKEDFSSKDYDYRLAAEIRSRTQGDQENITIYISIMHGMFSRLSKPMSEDEKLEILMHNIRPCYANSLAASPPIVSIENLRSVCRNYENITARFSQFQEPPRVTSNTVAPEFAYRNKTSYANNNKFNDKYRSFNNTRLNNNNYSNFKSNPTTSNNNKINAIDVSDQLQDEVAALYLEPTKPTYIYCPRCRSTSHSLGKCKQPRFLICFKCGKKDVRYPDCPECHPPMHKSDNQKN